MKQVLVLYHSQSGSTEQLAAAAAAGASVQEVSVRVRRAMAADLADLVWSDGIIFATPENFGALSGGMKDFFDRTYYPAQELQLNRAYGLIVSAGNDGSGAVRQLQRIVVGYPLRAIAEPLVIRGRATDADLARANELGQTLAAGLAMGIF
ncbi:MAG: multimeric flavodoxin WrbA [Halieaceae bacterium]